MIDQTPPGHEAQHRVLRLLRALLVHPRRVGRVEREGVRAPDLPVVVQRRGVKGPGLLHHDVGQAKLARQLRVLIARVHHADVRNEGARHIKGCKLYAVLPALDGLKHARRDALRRLAQRIARKHAVDVGVVRAPEALLRVDGIGIGAGNHQNLLARDQPALLLQLPEPGHQPGAAVQLLILVAAHAADDAQGLFALAEGIAGHAEVVPVDRLDLIEHFLFHCAAPPFRAASSICPFRMRAISEP